MQQSDSEVNDSLHSELVRRVMALEGREDTLRLNNKHLESTIETLAEYTSVSVEDIRGIAKELARSTVIADSPVSHESKASWLTSSGLKLASVILIVCAVLYAANNLLLSQPVRPDDATSVLSSGMVSGGLFHKKAMLGSALADITTVKMMVTMHLYERGAFPTSIGDLGLDAKTMVSSNISGLDIGENGAIVAQLPEKFGKSIELKLVPKLVMGGNNVEWDCYSNLPAYVLASSDCMVY